MASYFLLLHLSLRTISMTTYSIRPSGPLIIQVHPRSNPLGGDHTTFIDNVRITDSPKPRLEFSGSSRTQLGTPRMLFDEIGSLADIKRHDYLPFGEELGVGNKRKK